MQAIELVPRALFFLVAFLGALIILVLAGMFVLTALKVIFGGGKGSRQFDAEGAQLMQDLNRGFQKLEERVESLETIMLETGSTRRNTQFAQSQRQQE
jgi:phage shock protein B